MDEFAAFDVKSANAALAATSATTYCRVFLVVEPDESDVVRRGGTSSAGARSRKRTSRPFSLALSATP